MVFWLAGAERVFGWGLLVSIVCSLAYRGEDNVGKETLSFVFGVGDVEDLDDVFVLDVAIGDDDRT